MVKSEPSRTLLLVSSEAPGKGATSELCEMFMTREVLAVAKEAQGMSENRKKRSAR